jgi:hypothetical protein
MRVVGSTRREIHVGNYSIIVNNMRFFFFIRKIEDFGLDGIHNVAPEDVEAAVGGVSFMNSDESDDIHD